MKLYYGNVGIIIIHGFGGSIKEVEPLANKLRNLGYVVETPLLSGHTGVRKDYKKASYKDWIMDAEKAYLSLKDQCETIILIGFSMGGLLSFQIARKFNVSSIITLNTPIFIESFHNFLMCCLRFDFKQIKQSLMDCFRLPFKTYLHFMRLLKDTKKSLKDIKCDIMINQAYQDDVVKYKSANYIHDHVNSLNKKLMFYHKSKHLILQSEIAEEVMIDLVKYIENTSSNKKRSII